MSADRDPFQGLLGSVSDGEIIEWDDVVGRAGTDDRRKIVALRDVDRIGRFNRDLQRTMPVAASEPVAGNDVPRWGELLLLELCGAGANAEVYRAWDPGLRREVALKLLRPGTPGAAANADQSPLLDEGRALARVRHPHVVSVHGIDCRDGRVGLWMELVRGVTLEQYVESHGPLDAAEAARLGREIGSALAAVHEAGLLHRDIKPANVVRDPDGRFVLTDFGLGLCRRKAESPTLLAAGSPMYMAPELLAGAAPDTRSEVYALGMLLWFALTGRHPFRENSLAELRQEAADGPSPGLGERRPDLPTPLVEAVERATAPQPSQRYAGAGPFVEALDAIEVRPAVATPDPRPGRRTRTLLLTGASVVALVAALLVVVRGRAPLPPPAPATYAVEATLLRQGPGAPTPLVNNDLVAPGDRLSLQWRATRAAWVYVLSADDRGEAYLLFPQPRFDIRNPLPADSTLVLPGAMGGREVAWTVTSVGGRETFLVVVSPEPVPELEAGPAGFAAPDPDRPIEYAAVDAGAVQRLRGVGGLAAVAPPAKDVGPGSGALTRFRALAGRESGVTGVWVREIVLRNPG
jgi:serine/threonine-protein kinase